LTLEGVLHAAGLGQRLVPVITPRGLSAPVRRVALLDVTDPGEGRDTLFLAVGFDSPDGILDRLPSGAAAVVVRTGASTQESLVAAGYRSGTAVLALSARLSWDDVYLELRRTVTELHRGARSPGETGLDRGASALFDMADDLAGVAGGPVIIEDGHGCLLGYSHGQDEADAVRRETILQRGIPPQYLGLLRRTTLRILARSSTPFHAIPVNAASTGRLIAPLRLDADLLGNATAAVGGPGSASQRAAFGLAARSVAAYLFAARASAQTDALRCAALVKGVIGGGAPALTAARLLGLPDSGGRVLAFHAHRDELGPDVLDALRTQFEHYLRAAHPAAIGAEVGGTLYATLPGPAKQDARLAVRVARDVVAALSRRTRRLIVAGVGRHVPSWAAAGESAAQAEQVLVLLDTKAVPDDVVITAEDVALRLWLLRVQQTLPPADAGVGRQLQAVAAYDAERGTALVSTLRVLLDNGGRTVAAATELGIHVNTLRYRVKRLQEIGHFRFEDADERLALTLQLRLVTGS
jgi:hypothetical protein